MAEGSNGRRRFSDKWGKHELDVLAVLSSAFPQWLTSRQIAQRVKAYADSYGELADQAAKAAFAKQFQRDRAKLAAMGIAIESRQPEYSSKSEGQDFASYRLQLGDEPRIRLRFEQEDLPEGAKPSIWNMLVPVIVLLVFIFVGLFYTGDIKTNGFFGALANGSSLRALDTAFILASIAAIIMGMISKVWNFKKALSTFIEGCTGMMEVLMILMLAWGIGSICSACGTSTWIVSTCESFLTPTSMCAIIFIATCLTSFSTGSSWSVFAIFIPIAVPLAISIGAPVGMAIGVVLSGGIFGDHCSPISDTTVMSSMGSSCDHIDHVRTQLPYALTVAGSSLVGYIVSGLMKGGAFVGLAITLVLICLVSFLLNKHVGRGKDAKAPQDAA